MGDLLFPAVRGSCVVTVAARLYLTIDKKAAIPETAGSAIGDTHMLEENLTAAAC